MFAGFGYFLYRIDWWGGADVKIIAGLGFLANPLVLGMNAPTVWPYLEVSFFLNLCLASVVFFGVIEAYLWRTRGRIEKEVPYVPAFFLAWVATGAAGAATVGR